MASKLTRKLTGRKVAEERRAKWQFELRLSRCDGLASVDAEVCVQLSRHAKVVVSPCVPVVGGSASWADAGPTLALVCTLTHRNEDTSRGGAFEPKAFKLTLLQQRSAAARKGYGLSGRLQHTPLASCELDLAAFASEPTEPGGVHSRVLKLAPRRAAAAAALAPQLTLSVASSLQGAVADDEVSLSSQILGGFSLEGSAAAAAIAASASEQDLAGFDELGGDGLGVEACRAAVSSP